MHSSRRAAANSSPWSTRPHSRSPVPVPVERFRLVCCPPSTSTSTPPTCLLPTLHAPRSTEPSISTGGRPGCQAARLAGSDPTLLRPSSLVGRQGAHEKKHGHRESTTQVTPLDVLQLRPSLAYPRLLIICHWLRSI